MISAFGVEHGEISKGYIANAKMGFKTARVVKPHGNTDKHIKEAFKNFKGHNAGYKVGRHPVAATSVLGGTTAASAYGAKKVKDRRAH